MLYCHNICMLLQISWSPCLFRLVSFKSYLTLKMLLTSSFYCLSHMMFTVKIISVLSHNPNQTFLGIPENFKHCFIHIAISLEIKHHGEVSSISFFCICPQKACSKVIGLIWTWFLPVNLHTHSLKWVVSPNKGTQADLWKIINVITSWEETAS